VIDDFDLGAPFTGSFQSPAAGTMNAFDTTASNGIWTLTVADDSTIITGTLVSWSLTLDGPPPLPVELMSYEVD
jgi:subtilisin-like proprotein convertase family protein